MRCVSRYSRILAAGTVLSLGAVASANPLSFGLNYEFSGAQAPAGAGPWLQATFTQTGADSVRLTVQNNLSAGEWVSQLLFNISAAHVPTPNASVGFTYNSGLSSPATSPSGALLKKATNPGADTTFKADGDGFFDFRINWANGVFAGGETAVFDLSATGLLVSWFDHVSEPGGGAGAYHVAAHIQGVYDPAGAPGNTEGSGWIGNAIIPLPSAAGLALVGFLAIGGVRRR